MEEGKPKLLNDQFLIRFYIKTNEKQMKNTWNQCKTNKTNEKQMKNNKNNEKQIKPMENQWKTNKTNENT